jgi:hypothetical protein
MLSGVARQPPHNKNNLKGTGFDPAHYEGCPSAELLVISRQDLLIGRGVNPSMVESMESAGGCCHLTMLMDGLT